MTLEETKTAIKSYIYGETDNCPVGYKAMANSFKKNHPRWVAGEYCRYDHECWFVLMCCDVPETYQKRAMRR